MGCKINILVNNGRCRLGRQDFPNIATGCRLVYEMPYARGENFRRGKTRGMPSMAGYSLGYPVALSERCERNVSIFRKSLYAGDAWRIP